MCAICGCGGTETAPHAHPHDHPHDHDHPHSHAELTTIDIEARLLAKNDALAARTRAWLAGREVLALNLMSAPGAGKTSLIERTIADLGGEIPLTVIEGDQAGDADARRIRNAGAPVVQINTGAGCHLDARMVAKGLAELRPPFSGVVLVENVGNLVCPALFDLGEAARVVLWSVAEGEDKPVKYPHMFRAADLVLLAKTDLLPQVGFALDDATAALRAVNPEAPLLEVSARAGTGLVAWYDWLRQRRDAARTASFG